MKFQLSLAAATFVVGAVADQAYLTWLADSFIKNGVAKDGHYATAVIYEGIRAAYEFSGNETYLDWYKSQIDGPVVLEDGSLYDWDPTWFSLDDYRVGNNLLWWYNRTQEAKYKTAAEIIRLHINQHPRTPSGGFWHRQPVYPNQMWLDGIFMADSFYARWTAAFDRDNTTAWDDIVLQYDTIESHVLNATSGLLKHGYDESKVAVWADPVTGAAPLDWDRAIGWYFWSLTEVLEVFPQEHEGYQRLLGYFTSLSAALKKAQDKSGGFWLIMTEGYTTRAGNYIESSGTAMFAYGWFKGIRNGWISKSQYLAPAKKAYKLLEDKFITINSNNTLTMTGTVSVGSLSSNGSFEYYVSVPTTPNDYKGAGPFLVSAYEWETWAKN